ncbi:MAG: tRNA (adenosine(37)-N6)-threonylcarbamoyltransferase complex transferase subunit TsaD, partial [Patescibacteria group bacterium]
MKILAIETSCDETGASVVEKKNNQPFVQIHSNIIATSLGLHAKTGGIIPEAAAREQSKYIIPVIKEALFVAKTTPEAIDAIAVTIGPGLIGSLLIGVETAKTLAFAWNKPIIPVNHLFGHIYANWISSCHPALDAGSPARRQASFNDREIAGQAPTHRDPDIIGARNDKKISFPALGLIVSGGHTDLILIKNHGNIQWLGGTKDDAAGEAFDKIGRMLGLPYPSGAMIEERAKKGNPKAYDFPRPMIHSHTSDFSFSGLKAAVFREIKTIKQLSNETISDICASVQQAIIDVLVKKTLDAAREYNVKSILLGGGVAANQTLVEFLKLNAIRYNLNAEIFVPQKSLCTDNAAMIGAAAFYIGKPASWKNIQANPELYF